MREEIPHEYSIDMSDRLRLELRNGIKMVNRMFCMSMKIKNKNKFVANPLKRRLKFLISVWHN